MNRREWAKAGLAIGLLMLAILFAAELQKLRDPGFDLDYLASGERR